MVKNEARAKAAALIRQYLASEITNFEFIDQFPRDSSDPALRAIELRLWLFYSDVSEQHCEFPIGSPMESLWERCALFLDNSYQYEWGSLGHHNHTHPIVGVLSGDLFRLRAIAKRKRQGDYSVWPFLRRADFESATAGSTRLEIKADDDFPKVRLRAIDRVRIVLTWMIVMLQTAAFFSAVLIGMYSIFSHSNRLVTAALCFVSYLHLLGVGTLAEPLLRLPTPNGQP